MRSSSPASLNPFTDADLSDGALRTFTLICKLDRGPRGCFARRETLAEWRGLSVSAINHQVAELKRRGYITLSRKGRKASESSSIHVVDQARYALLSLLPDELRSQLLNEEEKNCTCSSNSNGKLQKPANGELQKSTNLQKSANGHHVIKEYCLQDSITTKNMVQGTKADVESTPDPVVVSLYSVDGFSGPAELDAGSNESHPARPIGAEKDGDPVARATQLFPESLPRSDSLSGVQALMEAGIDETNAHQLGHTYPAPRCRAAIAYVQDKGHGVKNPGGYIRFLLENDASIPMQYFKRELSDSHAQAADPEADSASNVIPLSVAKRRTTVPAVSFGPSTAVCPEREKRRVESPYSSLWEEVSENIGERIQTQSFETWFQPLFISEVGKTSVVFDAPDQLVADWVEENYIGLLTSALKTAGIFDRSISFETSTPSS
ncbi:MAG: hypothetical protein OXI59_11350 [Gemmatimonadota bacterium]|nr:hypothetical protein [Gemmatimonadota bacterium]